MQTRVVYKAKPGYFEDLTEVMKEYWKARLSCFDRNTIKGHKEVGL